MKKKIISIILAIVFLFTITSCVNKKEYTATFNANGGKVNGSEYYEIKFRKASNAAKNQINNAGDDLKAGLITISEFCKIVHKIDIKHNDLYFKILNKYSQL